MTDIAPGGAGVSRTPLAEPDPRLRAAVAEAIGGEVTTFCDGSGAPECRRCVQVNATADAALRATGEWLAETLGGGITTPQSLTLTQRIIWEAGVEHVIDSIRSLCGVPAPGAMTEGSGT